jgi:uncharacterized membrane protein HdeD (DUF308 family)
MITMIDTLPAATTALAVGPTTIAVALVLLAGFAWVIAGAAEEMRRMAARDWERSKGPGRPSDVDRLAA